MALIDKLKAIANAIREKSGTTDLIPLMDMPQAILDLSGGAEYTSIVYNEDNTITLIDKDGVEHEVVCVYEDDKLKSVSYDGKEVALTYDGDVLVNMGETNIDLSNAPRTPVTTLKADSSVVSVTLPVTVPTVTAEINGTVQADSSASLEE